MELPQLDLDLCRQRQQRLRRILADEEIDRAILSKPENVQYFTCFRPHHLMHAAVCIDDENCLLVAPNEEPARHAASNVITFEAQWRCTLRQEQETAIISAIRKADCNSGKIAVDRPDPGRPDIESEILKLRRRKDPDEVTMIRHAISGAEAMYARAKEIIEPGINELQVFNELQAAAVTAIGEPLTGTGNDYQANSPGGPPRNRNAEDGELYILDLGPAYRGYFADNCRTFAVNGRPTDEQLKAREVIQSVLDHVRAAVKPGVSCAQLFNDCKAMLDEYEQDSFFHHLGHGIGLYPHEAPHLNPAWDDTFAEGDVFTAEPGLYTETLRAGIRLEENYVVTADGVEQLTKFPTEL